MTRLLISVRNLSEAQLLPLNDVAILDIKEPRRGPLGCADLDTIKMLHRELGKTVSISAALGELVDCDSRQLEQLPPVAFAKFGLSQIRTLPDWKSLWTQRIAQLPTGTQPVAVIYADWDSCGAPSPEEVISAAQDVSCRVVLIDTFEKSKGSLFQWQTFSELQRITRWVRDLPAKCVLAGGLHSQLDLQNSLRLAPDLIGVRGAICGTDRADSIDVDRMNEFFRQFSRLVESNDVNASRSIESETPASESRNQGITP